MAGRQPCCASPFQIDACGHDLSLFISENSFFLSIFAYKWGMSSLQEFIDSHLARGRAYFSKPVAVTEVRQTPQALQAVVARLT